MGKDIRSKEENAIINDACHYIYQIIDELLPGRKQELETDVENNLKKEEGEISELTLARMDGMKKNRVQSWIKDKVINDYNFVTSIINKKFLLEAKKKERINIFVFFIKIRNSSLERFYNVDVKQENAIKSINAVLRTGQLQYSYEKLCDDFMQIMYKENYVKDSIFEMIPQLTEMRIRNAEEAKTIFYNSLIYNKDVAIKKWDDLLTMLWDIYLSIRTLEKEADKKIICAVRYIDTVSGIIRDVLGMFSWFAIKSGKSTTQDITKQYVNSVKGYLYLLEKLNRTKYPLFENYLVHVSMLSLIGERKAWMSIQSFLIKEVLEEEKPKKTDKYKREEKLEQLEIILQWFVQKREMPLPMLEDILINAAYTECFMYKNTPPELKRHGIKHFIKLITEEQDSLGLNMNKEEMFYYLKILRGVAREQGQLEWYIKKEQMMIEIYEMEKEIFGNAKTNGFLGKWAEAMIYGIKEVGNAFFNMIY